MTKSIRLTTEFIDEQGNAIQESVIKAPLDSGGVLNLMAWVVEGCEEAMVQNTEG